MPRVPQRSARSPEQVQRARAKERLAAWMTVPRSLDDIRGFLERHFARPVSRRTAERYRDWMADAFGAGPARTAQGRKGWVLARGAWRPAAPASSAQAARLRRAATWLEHQGRTGWAQALRELLDQAPAEDAPPRAARSELPAAVEAVAHVPMIRVRVAPWIEAVIQRAMAQNRALRVRYRMTKRAEGARRAGRVLEAVIHPYGIVSGERPFLVGAYDAGGRLARDREGHRRIGWYALDRFERIATTDLPIVGRATFDLEAYVRRWFGTPRGDEEPFEVAWRFSPAVAARAELYEFHPTQRAERVPDGSLIVRFRAAGSLEMQRHLAGWGGDVEVLAPDPGTFRRMVEEQQVRWRAYFA